MKTDKSNEQSFSITSFEIPHRKELRWLLREFYKPTGENRVETTIDAEFISIELKTEILDKLKRRVGCDVIVRSITIVSYNSLQGTKANKFCVNFKLDMVGNEKTEVE